jgi:hypothetical protein
MAEMCRKYIYETAYHVSQLQDCIAHIYTMLN